MPHRATGGTGVVRRQKREEGKGLAMALTRVCRGKAEQGSVSGLALATLNNSNGVEAVGCPYLPGTWLLSPDGGGMALGWLVPIGKAGFPLGSFLSSRIG